MILMNLSNFNGILGLKTGLWAIYMLCNTHKAREVCYYINYWVREENERKDTDSHNIKNEECRQL